MQPDKQAVLERGLEALRWLTELQMSEKGHFPAHRQQRLLPPRRHARQFRPAAHRGAGNGLGLSGSLSRHIGLLVVRTGATRLRLVHRLERSRTGTLLSRDRRLPRWVACRSGQREPGSGIHPGLPAFVGGDALGAKHGDEFQGTDRHRRVGIRASFCNMAIHVNPRQTHSHDSQTRPVARSSAALQSREIRSGSRGSSPGSWRSRKSEVGPLLDEVSAEFSQRHQQIRNLFLERFEQVRDLLSADEELSEQRRLSDRLLFPGRILSGIRCPVQSVHRAAPRPDRSAARRAAVHSQPARHRGRTHFFHHVSDRHHPSRSADRGIHSQLASSPSRARSQTPVYEKALFGRKLS